MRGALNFLLDSGAGASVLDLRTAQRLGLKLGAPTPIRGVESQAVAYRIPPLLATNGESGALASISLVVDLANAERICGEPVDGLLGSDFFKNRIVQIDYAAHRIRFPERAPTAGSEALPLRYRNGVLCTQISVNGSRPRWTRLDTGCNDSLHWVIPRSRPTNAHQGVSIGFLTDARDQTLTAVSLGKLSLPCVETSLHGRALFPGESGLLGNGILSRFTVTIDSGAHRVYLQPSSAGLSQ